jgi:hypothetical protein
MKRAPDYVLRELENSGFRVVSQVERGGGGHYCVRFTRPGLGECKWSFPDPKRCDPHGVMNNRSELRHYIRRVTLRMLEGGGKR